MDSKSNSIGNPTAYVQRAVNNIRMGHSREMMWNQQYMVAPGELASF